MIHASATYSSPVCGSMAKAPSSFPARIDQEDLFGLTSASMTPME